MSSTARLLVLLVGTTLAACGGASPHVKVLGAEQSGAGMGAPVLRLFVEVVNPTGRGLRLSRLEYDLSAERVFATKGAVSVERDVAAGQSAVVEIVVPVDRRAAARLAGVPYKLDGRLFAHADHMDQYWPVRLRGELEAAPRAGGHVLRVKLGSSREGGSP
jgi:hypothetical protein